MASLKKRRSENVEGNFFVDSTCIDCDTCRWLAPSVFKSYNGQSIVFHQPENDAEENEAIHALISCPTSSIGILNKTEKLLTVSTEFPIPISETIFYCGYHSEKSYGAASYFIKSDLGNILIDSPRFAIPLVNQIEKLGGIKYLFLTHGDDVADHEKFVSHFGCKRIMHRGDLSWSAGKAEIIFDDFVQFSNEIQLVPVPGHTKGSAVLLYQNKFLFTGDHLAFSERLQNLYAFRNATWFSWESQIESMIKLLDYNFEWVLPGHGRRFNGSLEEMKFQLQKCIDWMKKK